MFKLAAVAVLHCHQQVSAVRRRIEKHFGNPRKLFADHVGICFSRRTQGVIINLLVEIQILLRTLAGVRQAGIIKTAAVGTPGNAAAGGRKVDARDHISTPLSGGRIVEIQRAVLAATFGYRNGDRFAIAGRGKKIDRRFARGIKLRRINEHPTGLWLVG